MAYYEFSIRVADQSKEALIQGLSEIGCLGMIDREEGLIAYFPDVLGIGTIVHDLTTLKTTIRESGLEGEFSFDYVYLSERDWNESWKKKFQPIDVGERFSIVPPWEDERPNRTNLIIDPGMAFGTGHHETTKKCLMLIERYSTGSPIEETGSPSPDPFHWEGARARGVPKDRFLDIGTGSGILAIAAAKLGYRHVVAVDIDPLAVDATRRNVTANSLTNVEVKQGTLSDVEGTYDLIAANLLSETLITLAPGIALRLARPGIAILSGIIKGQEDEVIPAMERDGLRLFEKHVDGRWVSLVLIRDE